MKKSLRFVALLLALSCVCALVFAGCAQQAEPQPSEILIASAEEAVPAPTPVEIGEASGVSYEPPAEESSLQTAAGSYVGQADNNFFEVKLDGKQNTFAVFMITDDIRATFERLALREGDRIELEYSKNEVGQNVVSNIRLE